MLNPVTHAFADALCAQLPPATRRSEVAAYAVDLRGRVKGQTELVLAPANAEEVATIVRACAEARVPIVPYGGGTGLVRGHIAPDGPAPVILSLERMQAIRATYPSENVLVAEAGATLVQVQEAAKNIDRLFALSLASEGSCRIGGNLSTNAGGLNVLRYGNARDQCLGLEAVLPNGEIWHGLKRLRKDNTGYDLRNLLIGAEGTLGIITAAALRLYPRPAREGTALIVVPTPEAALDLLTMARDLFAEGVSAFELISGTGLAMLAETFPDLHQPFSEPPEWSVLIGLGLPDASDPQAGFETLFERAVDADIASDGVIAQSETQAATLWQIRETIPEANRAIGAIGSHDVSLPLSAIPAFLAEADAALRALADMRINAFGHLGDGNLHYNIFPVPGRTRDSYDSIKERATRIVYDIVARHDGSFSAEHGLGRLKVDELERYGDPARLGAMRAIKAALDPLGIMNPGAVLRAPS